MIIDGHTHIFLDEPTVVERFAGEKMLVNQMGRAGINVGRIDYTFGRRK